MEKVVGKKETLVEFLKLNEFSIKGGTLWNDIITNKLKEDYGYNRFRQDEEYFRRNIKNRFLCSSEFGEYYLSHFPENMSDSERRKLADGMEERFDKASLEEIIEVVNIITGDIEKNNSKTYYYAMTDAYYSLMKDSEEFSNALCYFKTNVENLLRSYNEISLDEIVRINNDEKGLYKSLFDLPPEIHRDIIVKKMITISDLKVMNEIHIELDKKRNQLHKKMEEYAKRHFQKDYLDVYIDFMRHELFPADDLVCFSPTKKGFILNIGLIEMSAGRSEFNRCYGEEYSDNDFRRNYVERAYRALEQARKSELECEKPKYKSFIKNGRIEKEDEEFLDHVVKRFKEYIAFRGDYAFKNSHGVYIFGKLIEFDMNKIRAKEEYPENKIGEIRSYISSLLPEKKA
jgi:hypothetical protein